MEPALAACEARCRQSHVVPLTDEIIVLAADIYAHLYPRGQLIGDADILLAATALTHGTILVTENADHFGRIRGLRIESWRDV